LPGLAPRASDSRPDGRGNASLPDCVKQRRRIPRSNTDSRYRSMVAALVHRLVAAIRDLALRYHGQRLTSVMVRVSQKFVRETPWPQFEALQATLRDYFDDFTSRIIVEALDGDPRDAEER
jgi:hypothetical protein